MSPRVISAITRIFQGLLSFIGGCILGGIFYNGVSNGTVVHSPTLNDKESVGVTIQKEAFEPKSQWLNNWVSQEQTNQDRDFSLKNIIDLCHFEQEIFNSAGFAEGVAKALGLSSDEEDKIVTAFKAAEERIQSSVKVTSSKVENGDSEIELIVYESLEESEGLPLADELSSQFSQLKFKDIRLLLLPAIDATLLRFGEFKRKTVVRKEDNFLHVKTYLVDRESGNEHLVKEATSELSRLSRNLQTEIAKVNFL